MRPLFRLSIAFLLVVLAPLIAAAQMPRPQPADPARLAELERDIWRPFSAAIAARDAPAHVALHSAQFVRASGDLKRVQTFAQWRDDNLQMFARLAERDIRPAIAFRFSERLAGAEVASERGIYEFAATDAKGETRRYYGQFHVISRKENGRWRLLVDYDSSEGGTITEANFRAAHAIDDYARY